MLGSRMTGTYLGNEGRLREGQRLTFLPELGDGGGTGSQHSAAKQLQLQQQATSISSAIDGCTESLLGTAFLSQALHESRACIRWPTHI